ncbi:MAG: thermonuclease family protein [Azospirillum sp.]|nr:thermonuclease family protein [Azospirillum sp.]
MSGDLLVVGGARVRLLGIAAPVVGQMCKTRYGRDYDCFKLSADVLANLIGTQEVECRVVTTDRTGQQVGVCRSGGADLGAAMVARGWAFAYRSLELDYARAEAFAQSRRLGMWAGRVEMPWQYQSRQLRDQAKPGP